MITIGAILRNAPFPKSYLAIPYTTIGGALLLANLLYYRRIWQPKAQKEH